MSYLLAIDGGGTKTKTLAVDFSGQILGEGLSGPSSLTATNLGAAGFSLRESIRQARAKLPAEQHCQIVVMGLAGMDTEAEKQMALTTFSQVLSELKISKFILVNDIEIALASGTDSLDAVALISGTGSNCFGRNSFGQTAKTGGLDFLLTDQGSGYDIGRRVLREAVKSFDGRSPKSLLENMVCDHFQVKTIPDLKSQIYNPLISKPRVAELAMLCFEACEDGDQVATQILKDAVAQLVIMVETVLRRLDLKNKPTDLVLAGRITKQAFIQELLKQELKQIASALRIIIPEVEPVMGAVKMALKQVGV